MQRDEAVNLVLTELTRARLQFPHFHSAHEGYAVILEELDELWQVIKEEHPLQPQRLQREATQVAAMALRFLTDLC